MGIEWSALLASAQAMVKRHQNQLAEELRTESGNAPHAQQAQQQQQPQYQQASLQHGLQPTAAAAAAAAAAAVGPSAGENQVAGLSSVGQQSDVGDQGQAVTVKEEAGTSQTSEEAWLSDMVVGCVSMLLTMQKCAQQPVAGHPVNTALVNSLKMLQPHAASNQPIYRKIEQTVTVLRNQLLQGSSR